MSSTLLDWASRHCRKGTGRSIMANRHVLTSHTIAVSSLWSVCRGVGTWPIAMCISPPCSGLGPSAGLHWLPCRIPHTTEHGRMRRAVCRKYRMRPRPTFAGRGQFKDCRTSGVLARRRRSMKGHSYPCPWLDVGYSRSSSSAFSTSASAP